MDFCLEMKIDKCLWHICFHMNKKYRYFADFTDDTDNKKGMNESSKMITFLSNMQYCTLRDFKAILPLQMIPVGPNCIVSKRRHKV